MASANPADFRREAALESQRILAESGLSNPLNSESSLCLPNVGDATGSLYRIALVPWFFMLPGLLLFLFGIVYGILVLTPWVDLSLKSTAISLGSMIVGIVVFFMSGSVSDGIYDAATQGWNGASFMKDFESRVAASHHFCIEDPATYTKQKIISEDYAKGGLDRSGRGLLLAGCQYRYVLRPHDVTELREDKKVFVVTVRIGVTTLTLALSPLVCDDEEERRFVE